MTRSMHTSNPLLLRTHRGRPHAVINTDDACQRGINDGDEIRVWNDMGEFFVAPKVAPGVSPGQVIVCNGWEPYMFRGRSRPRGCRAGPGEVAAPRRRLRPPALLAARMAAHAGGPRRAREHRTRSRPISLVT